MIGVLARKGGDRCQGWALKARGGFGSDSFSGRKEVFFLKKEAKTFAL
jgi:hypothetical protein